MMNRDEVKSRLSSAKPATEPRADCPANETLASYVDGGLSETEHAAFELHLADCGWCMARVGMLGRAHEREPEQGIPEFTLAMARRIGGAETTAPAPWRRRAPRWAAAAAVVLAVALTLLGPRSETPPAGDSADRAVRTAEPLSRQPRLLWPADGAVMGVERITFDWSPVADSLYYQVRVVTDAGDLVWQEQLPGTHWSAPADLHLTPGADYYVRVDAFLTETKSVSSDYVAFRMGGEPLR